MDAWLGHIPLDQFKSRFIELDSHGYVWKDHVYRQLINEFDIQCIAWEDLLSDYIAEFHRHCVPFPHMMELLEFLKNQQMLLGIITNGFTDLQTSNIRALGVESYFSTTLISENLGIKKPDQRIFLRALTNIGVSARESLYVGDHPINDVQASRLAGMTAVWKRSPNESSHVEANFIIDDLLELIEIVEHFQANCQ